MKFLNPQGHVGKDQESSAWDKSHMLNHAIPQKHRKKDFSSWYVYQPMPNWDDLITPRNAKSKPVPVLASQQQVGIACTKPAWTNTKTKKRTRKEKWERERRGGRDKELEEMLVMATRESRGPWRADNGHQSDAETFEALHPSPKPLIERDRGKGYRQAMKRAAKGLRVAIMAAGQQKRLPWSYCT